MANKIDKTDEGRMALSSSGLKLDSNNKQHTPSLNRSKHYKNPRVATECGQHIRFCNPEDEFISREQETLKKLVDINQSYLTEKIKVSDVPTPPKYSHKIPSKTGLSQYILKYGSRSRPMSIQPYKMEPGRSGSLFSMPHAPVGGYESTYHLDFPKKLTPQIMKKSQRSKYEKNNAPTFNETSYHRDYKTLSSCNTASAKRAQISLMGGGKLSEDTTYKQNFKMRTDGLQPKVTEPILHKDHRIFLTLQNPQQSNYDQTFNQGRDKGRKHQVGVESCKPKDKYRPMVGKMKYKTQYRGQFVKQAISKKNAFECLSPQQLKNYVMNILTD